MCCPNMFPLRCFPWEILVRPSGLLEVRVPALHWPELHWLSWMEQVATDVINHAPPHKRPSPEASGKLARHRDSFLFRSCHFFSACMPQCFSRSHFRPTPFMRLRSAIGAVGLALVPRLHLPSCLVHLAMPWPRRREPLMLYQSRVDS